MRAYYFAGGGTGGHLFPGLAVADALRTADTECNIVFVGSERSLESGLVTKQGYEHRSLPAEPLSSLKKNPISFFWRNWTAYRLAKAMLRKNRPAAVIGLGGFASAPLVLAASRMSIPTVLLEQNSIPGKSTRWLSRWAKVVCLSYDGSARYFSQRRRLKLTGNPVRNEITQLFSTARTGDEGKLESTSDRRSGKTLLVLGGSQGAQPLNDAIIRLLQSRPTLLADWQIVHQTGVSKYAEIQRQYDRLGVRAEVAAFLPDMAVRYRQASLVISRAGATTLAELACAGIPALLVPYPHTAENHQWHNARTFELAGAAEIVHQGAVPEHTASVLGDHLQRLLHPESPGSSTHLERMSQAMRTLARPEATQEVLRVIHELVNEHWRMRTHQ